MPFVASTQEGVVPYPNTSAIMKIVRPPASSFTVPPTSQPPKSNISALSIPDVYAPFPPRLMSDVSIPRRVNPLRPQMPDRRTVALETADPTQHNDERRNLMARREHNRVHHLWSRYYYGNIAEKEIFRRYIREGLKQQMQEQNIRKKEDFSNKIHESVAAVQKDKDDITKEAVTSRDHHHFLTKYRDANKEMMEQRESIKKEFNQWEKKFESEQLRYNPINWSGSLT